VVPDAGGQSCCPGGRRQTRGTHHRRVAIAWWVPRSPAVEIGQHNVDRPGPSIMIRDTRRPIYSCLPRGYCVAHDPRVRRRIGHLRPVRPVRSFAATRPDSPAGDEPFALWNVECRLGHAWAAPARTHRLARRPLVSPSYQHRCAACLVPGLAGSDAARWRNCCCPNRNCLLPAVAVWSFVAYSVVKLDAAEEEAPGGSREH
jgi:hypothetical protein